MSTFDDSRLIRFFLTMTDVQILPSNQTVASATASTNGSSKLQKQTNGKEEDSELNEEDRRLIRADWDIARQDLQTVATKLFLVFFQQNPTYPQMFRWTKGMDISSLNINTPFDSLPKRMHFHALTAAKQISVIVDNLEKPEALEALFTTLGEQHVGRNVGQTHWERFNIALLSLLRELLTPAGYDDRHERAWKKALQVITDATLRTTLAAEEASKAKSSLEQSTTNGVTKGNATDGNA